MKPDEAGPLDAKLEMFEPVTFWRDRPPEVVLESANTGRLAPSRKNPVLGFADRYGLLCDWKAEECRVEEPRERVDTVRKALNNLCQRYHKRLDVTVTPHPAKKPETSRESDENDEYLLAVDAPNLLHVIYNQVNYLIAAAHLSTRVRSARDS